MLDRQHIPSLSILFAFDAAMRHQSFTLAAEELNVTQSAISRQIKQLEAILGMQLFLKSGRNVRSTDAAALYAKRVHSGLKEIADGTKFIMGHQGAETVKLGVLPTTSSRWLVPRLSTFIEENPRISVVLSVQTRQFDFSNANIDSAIHCGLPDWEGVEYDLLGEEELLVVCSPDLISNRKVRSVEDLSRHTLITTNTRQDDWHRFFPKGVGTPEGNRRLEFETFSSVIKATMAGLGLAIIPTFLIRNELADRRLVSAYGKKYLSGRGYYHVYPKDRLDYQAFRSFRMWLLKQARESLQPTQ
ncbi:LysR family transcriptional regulator [Lentibacter algarum]|uniref:LysR substrate-binding domain-containing protein n=1 Tax=Lentibacter algarum TaxID=576131 RepID=UPI001C08AC3C|nr:LysR substrate-binding domain-containing protein [Lentibacter algarum]MBU2983675.1 LysR family transcriptional regulator [Lentibacter algarum]